MTVQKFQKTHETNSGTWHRERQHYWFTWMWPMSGQRHGPHETESIRAWECLYPRLLGACRFVSCAGLLAATVNQWGSWGRPWEAVLTQQSNLNHILAALSKATEQNRSLSLSGSPIRKPSPIPWKYSCKPHCSICLKSLSPLTCPLYLNPCFP